MGQLVGEEQLLDVAELAAEEVLAAEQRSALRLHRQPAEAVGHRDAVPVERVRAEEVVEEVDLLVDRVEERLHQLEVVAQHDADAAAAPSGPVPSIIS